MLTSGNRERLTAVGKSWQTPLAFSALVVCLCIMVLRVPPLLVGYGVHAQMVFLGMLAAGLLADALLSRTEGIDTLLRSAPLRILIFVLLSPLWGAPLRIILLSRLSPVSLSSPVNERHLLIACELLLACGLALLIPIWLASARRGSGKSMIRSLLSGVLLSACLLVLLSMLRSTVIEVGLLILLTSSACLPSPEAQRVRESTGDAAPTQEVPALLERLLLVGLCVIGFTFQLLGAVALSARPSQGIDAIYLAGALVVLAFFAAQLYFVGIHRLFSWRRVALACAVLVVGMSAFVLFFSQGDFMAGVRTEIMVFGSTSFVTGVLLFVLLHAQQGKRPLRTALFTLSAFFASATAATALVSWYEKAQGKPADDLVFLLLLLAAVVIVGFLMGLLGHRTFSKLVRQAIRADEVAERQEEIRVLSLEERCLDLQRTGLLTAREAEVLLYAARGKTAIAIAEALYISRDTVNTHVQHIYRKLGVGSRDELIELVDNPAGSADRPGQR